MVNAVINDKFKNIGFFKHPIFKLFIPLECPNVPSDVLNPRVLWDDQEEYDRKALELAKKFRENFQKFKNVSKEIEDAGITSLTIV